MNNSPVFYKGISKPYSAVDEERVVLSVNGLLQWPSDFNVNEWIMDSGAFARIVRHVPHMPDREYAALVRRWSKCGFLQAAVCQEYPCVPETMQASGMTIAQHQALTTRAYLDLRELVPDVYVMPVLQGWVPVDFGEHLRELSPHLDEGAWVAIGSVFKRQGKPQVIATVLDIIEEQRPDLRLHGVGVRLTALREGHIARRLHSVDSLPWALGGRLFHPAHKGKELVKPTLGPSQLPMLGLFGGDLELETTIRR